MEDIELWGGPHDGQFVCVREDQDELRMPYPAEPLDNTIIKAGESAIIPIAYALYRRDAGTRIFKWDGDGNV